MEDEAHPLDQVAPWVGRTVSPTDDELGELGPAIVLAVDDTPHAPSAWIKYGTPGCPSYRSMDLSDLEDVETGRSGPRWGTGGMAADLALKRAGHFATVNVPSG